MSDFAQTVVVTVVAAFALGVLVRPLLPGRKRQAPPGKAGCASCEEHPVSTSAGH